MKNNLKFTLSLAFVSLFGIGCKKNLVEPISKQSTEQNGIKLQQSTVKVRAIGFQAEQDGATVGLSGTPLLLLKNTPADTKQFIVIMDGVDRTQTTRTLWIAAALGNLKQIDAQGFNMQQKQIISGEVKNVMTFHRATSFKSCKTEVFALNRELLPEEIERLKTMTRETFRTYCQNPNTKVTLLSSAVATDATKALENSIKTMERAIERAKISKQKTEEKFTAGNATKHAVNLAEHKLASLEKELLSLKNRLLDHP